MDNLELVGEGRTTKVYRNGDIASKVYINAPVNEAYNEAKKQQFAYDAGLPVPKVYGVRRIDDNTVSLDMEYIDGVPIANIEMDEDTILKAMAIAIGLHCEIHRVDAAGLPTYLKRISEKINGSQYLDNTQKIKLLSALSNQDNSVEKLCHGDFHPQNILFDGQKYTIIDWVDAASGNPLTDVCRTYLIFIEEEIYDFAEIYLDMYCKASNVDKSKILQWLPFLAAARLEENTRDDRRTMIENIVTEWCESN